MKLNLIEELEARSGGIKVSDLAAILGVDDKHIYRMAARGQLPSFRVGGAVRFDPHEVANWLRLKYGDQSHPNQEESTARGCAFAGGIERSVVRWWWVSLKSGQIEVAKNPTLGVLRATIYNSRPATAMTTSRKKRLGVRSSAFVPRTSTVGLIPLS